MTSGCRKDILGRGGCAGNTGGERAAAAAGTRFNRLRTSAARPLPMTLAHDRRRLRPEIRGILFAGGQSLVNFGGEIIGPGEEANGYRLLEVGEEHAVFQRGDEIVTLSLYPDGGVDADADR